MELNPVPVKALFSTHPETIFLAKESSSCATSLLGSYRFNRHFQIALSRTPLEGNSYVYKHRVRRNPNDFVQAGTFHAFLLGTVEGTGSAKPASAADKLSHNAETVKQMKLVQITNPSNKAQELFERGHSMLNEILNEEMSNHGSIERAWVGKSPKSPIVIDYGWFSEFIDGPMDVGSDVLMDVTLHRHDAYADGLLVKNYSLIAHEIHVVDAEDLQLTGFVNLALEDLTEELKISLNIGR
ncbi:hypothetical protein C8F04DRAFT_1191604 [Mycena alexandri]|uniref:Uncharacterized protein n=1 Tax=Mycena alexandri TaxID=1745969 RepID=A0AAD6WUG1_9AGAR|nr:hypothetical protein C8F04DRAFT_1191604 [Mycena alexandri]